MIKAILLHLLLVVIVGAVAAPTSNEEQQFIKANDQLEVAQLGPDQTENFSTFCLVTRDLIHEYLDSRNQRDFATDILKTLFQSSEKLALEPYTFERGSAEQLASKIRDSDNNLADLEVSSMVQLPKEEKFAYLALFGVIDHTKNEATRQTLNKLENYREVFGPTNMHKNLNDACKVVGDLEFVMSSTLKEYMSNMHATLPGGLPSLRCFTGQKLVHLNGICRFVLQAPKVQSELTYAPVGAHFV